MSVKCSTFNFNAIWIITNGVDKNFDIPTITNGRIVKKKNDDIILTLTPNHANISTNTEPEWYGRLSSQAKIHIDMPLDEIVDESEIFGIDELEIEYSNDDKYFNNSIFGGVNGNGRDSHVSVYYNGKSSWD